MKQNKKFRAWDNKNEKYLSDFMLFKDARVVRYIYKIKKDAFYFEDIDANLEMWTGLTDKNSKPIFEGDIIKLNYTNPVVCEVVYQERDDPNGIGFVAKRMDMELHFSCESNREVIGNIHTNNELLEGG